MSLTIRFDNGDLEIDSTGGQTLISGAEKAAQDLLNEIFLPYNVATDRGNELFNPDGSLAQIVGNPVIGAQTIRSFIKAAVRRLQRRQRHNPLTSRNELITEIKTLIVRPLGNDVTSYGFYLAVVVDDENIAVARAIRMGHLGETSKPLVGGYDPA